MPNLSFQSRLLLAMVLLVAAVSCATLLITESHVQQFNQGLFRALARNQFEDFIREQRYRLQNVKDACLRAASLPRVRAAVDEGESEQLYKAVKNDLAFYFGHADQGRDAASGQAVFYRCLDARGRVFEPPEDAAAGPLKLEAAAAAHLVSVVSSLAQAPEQVAYLSQPDSHGTPRLLEVVFTLIYDEVAAKTVGALMLGFPLEVRASGNEQVGILYDGQIYSTSIPEALRPVLVKRVQGVLGAAEVQEEDIPIEWQQESYRLFLRSLTSPPGLPKAYCLVLIPMREAQRAKRHLRAEIIQFGALGLAAAFGISLLLSRGLSVPVRELVAGTAEIRRGNLAVTVPVRRRDEMGRLAESFNDMVRGLALKERYRNVLNVVTDKEVAEELLRGEIVLGGETRDVTVLFCDIRGFTPLSQNMTPAEVIDLLNDHMTAMTRVVYEHRGVVDKFVGDLIMAVFGAPRSYGQDARHAATCALAMIRVRAELNRQSARRIAIGIGIASGPVVAGCMGSTDRLNYTVLGERVNLASRLCGRAGPMEVLLDQTTQRLLGDAVCTEAVGELDLKGFAGTVPAYRLVSIRDRTAPPPGSPAEAPGAQAGEET